ncbi:hypothetical protein J4482_01010 [Candidatus Woesearchaeota archaeon]|nr:hypothetical protein [Candidatus Woesearchaeota archaeon]
MKKGVFIFILLFLLLFINTEARGIGMRSGSLTVSIDFVPNFQQTYYYSVIPYGDEPMDVGMYVENDNKDGTTSDLSKYFIIEPTIFKSVMPKQEPFFSVTVRLPGEIEEPGTHKLHVSAAEAFPDGGGVGIKAAVEAIFYIHVPYDGQYLTYSNLGKEMINELYADIVLFDSQKNEADRIKTETIGLKSQENTILKNEIKTVGLSAGEYTVNATVHYDGKQVSKIQKIKVGELKLIILNQTQEITAGKVNEINVDIGSEWAETVKNVYAQVQIGDKQPVKTLSENLLGFQKTRLKAFFDAIDMKPGVYDMITKVYYEEKMTSKITMINVIKGVSSESAESNISFTNILLITVILVVVIINIVLFKILLKKKDENEKER